MSCEVTFLKLNQSLCRTQQFFWKSLREPAVFDNADGRCRLISHTTAKGMRLARFLMEKLQFLDEAM